MGGSGSNIHYTRPISNSNKPMNAEDDCDSIIFDTELQSLQPTFVNYVEDDVLKVQLDSTGRILVTGIHGSCGYITSIDAIQIIECLKKGKKFKAVVLNINTSYCKVRIRTLK